MVNSYQVNIATGINVISDIVIYLIYIDLLRKRCQLINVDVDVVSF